jgi:tRNA(adenine34) deaminase
MVERIGASRWALLREFSPELILPVFAGIFTAMQDELFMEICIEEALKAAQDDEVPVGAAVVSEAGKVIARAHNLTIRRNSPLGHAELIAIEAAAASIGNYRLVGCTLVVSKEPCLMCAGAIQEARIRRVVFGCFDPKRGAFGSACDANTLPSNHRVEVRGGLLRERSEGLLKEFFQARRDTEVVVTGPTRNRLTA